MIERRGSFGFLHKAAHPIVMSSDFSGQNLQRNFAIELRILRQINLSHSAFAKLRADFVTTEFCACDNRHRVSTEVSDQDHITRHGAAREGDLLAVA